MLQSDKNSQQLLLWLKNSVNTAQWHIQPLFLLLLLNQLLCNILQRMPAVQWQNITEITANMRLLFMTTCQNRLLLTVKCHCFSAVLQDVKLSPVTFSTCTHVCSNVLRSFLMNLAAVLLLLFRLSKPRQVTFLHIFLPT